MPDLNFFLAGVTKGGTSTLHRWLDQHPQVFLPKRKEMHHFCSCPELRGPHKVVRGALEYARYFEDAATRIIGEASPCYMYYPDVPSTLAQRYPHSRIVISLRDPVERFWSHYLMNEIYRPTGLAADQVVDMNLRTGPSTALDDLIGVGRYAEQVARLFSAFGQDRVYVTFLEDIAQDPERIAMSIQEFLGVDPYPINTSERDKQYVEPRNAIGRVALRNRRVRNLGVALLPWRARRLLRTKVLGDPNKKPRPPEPLRARLRQIYEPESLDLERLLRRQLPWRWYQGSGR